MESKWDNYDFNSENKVPSTTPTIKPIGLTKTDMSFIQAALIKLITNVVLSEEDAAHAGRLIHRFGRA